MVTSEKPAVNLWGFPAANCLIPFVRLHIKIPSRLSWHLSTSTLNFSETHFTARCCCGNLWLTIHRAVHVVSLFWLNWLTVGINLSIISTRFSVFFRVFIEKRFHEAARIGLLTKIIIVWRCFISFCHFKHSNGRECHRQSCIAAGCLPFCSNNILCLVRDVVACKSISTSNTHTYSSAKRTKLTRCRSGIKSAVQTINSPSELSWVLF